jgi:hypothetical protein
MARSGVEGLAGWCRLDADGALTWAFAVERVTRIELALSAWEADVLPLNYTRARPSVQLWLGTCS